MPPPNDPAVTVVTTTLVDTARATRPAGTGVAAAATRTLHTTIHLPADTRPAPLVVFSHGLGGSPDRFTRLLGAWAAAGYVVAAPRFPLTSDANPDHQHEVRDLWRQPGDVSFLIDEVVAASQAPDGPLAGRVDSQRIGAAGLSLGGATTYGLVLNDRCADERITAAVVLAGAVLITTGTNDPRRGVPLLAVHGDADATLPYAFGRSAWASLHGPAWLVTLVGGGHSAPFEDDPTPWDDAVAASTVAFWEATLGGSPSAINRLGDVVASAGGLVTVDTLDAAHPPGTTT